MLNFVLIFYMIFDRYLRSSESTTNLQLEHSSVKFKSFLDNLRVAYPDNSNVLYISCSHIAVSMELCAVV